MYNLSIAVLIIHLTGLAIGLGAATVKLVLVLQCKSNPEFFSIYFKVAKPITRLIITGMILLTLSGIGWLLMDYPFTNLLIFKIILVAAVWGLGPVIDNLIEPKLLKLVETTEKPSPAVFLQMQNRYLAMEITATGIMYAITIIGVLL